MFLHRFFSIMEPLGDAAQVALVRQTTFLVCHRIPATAPFGGRWRDRPPTDTVALCVVPSSLIIEKGRRSNHRPISEKPLGPTKNPASVYLSPQGMG